MQNNHFKLFPDEIEALYSYTERQMNETGPMEMEQAEQAERPVFNGDICRSYGEQIALKEAEYRKQNRQRFYSTLIATCAQYMAGHSDLLDEALEVQQYVLRRMKRAKRED